MNNTDTDILLQLRKYKNKYFLNQLVKNVLMLLAVLSTTYLVLVVGEYFGRFDPITRGVMFFILFVVTSFCSIGFLMIPLYKYLTTGNQMSDDEASLLIASIEPKIGDKLIHLVQLSRLDPTESSLLAAAIEQKTNEIKPFYLPNFVRIRENVKLLVFALPPVLIFVLLLYFVPNILSEGSIRIINFKNNFIGQAPFRFVIQPVVLEGVEGQDFDLIVKLDGDVIPDNVFVHFNDKRVKMFAKLQQEHHFTFQSPTKDIQFKLEAGNYFSDNYTIKIRKKPSIEEISVSLEYPKYLNKKNEKLTSIGNLTVPEGTKAKWSISLNYYESITATFEKKPLKTEKNLISGSVFFSNTLSESGTYDISIKGMNENMEEKLVYNVEVIKDQYPVIQAESVQDTVLYSYLSIGGFVKDDYGISKIGVFYKESKAQEFKFIPLENNYQTSQNFIFNWSLDSLKLTKGDVLEYYVAVWDNDGFNGAKLSKSAVYQLKIPDTKELYKMLELEASETSKQLDKTLNMAMEMDKDFKKIQNRLKGKKNFDWEDKKAIEELIKKQQELRMEVEKLQNKNQSMQMKNEKFSEQDELLVEKAQKLQELLDELLDEETKKLYEQLQKMLEDKNKEGEIKQMLDKLEIKDDVLEKELDRAMEFFKQIQFQQKLENTINQLDQLSEKQEQLSEKTKESNQDENELKKEQSDIEKEFNELKNELSQLKKMNQELEQKNQMPDTDTKSDEIQKEMQKAAEQMQKSQKTPASKSQKNASKGMKELSEKLSQMKTENQMKQNAENIDDLRQILDNLLTLSFEQEEIMKQFKKVNQSDPRYIQLSQRQLKLKDDSKVIEDSLVALSKRVHQIRSFVIKELADMNYNLNEASIAIKQRQPYLAAGKQQTAMTSINNLALMLSDILQQMQQDQQSMMQGAGMCNKPNKGKPKQKGNKPNLSQLQQQLNQQMQQMMKNGKSGRELSEALAKMAAQQERIRKAMKDLEQMRGNDGKNSGQGKLNELKKLMEKTEEDLVNKRLTPDLIRRQQDILTRLLEAENAQRERDLDNKRESNTGNELAKPVPPSLEKYLKSTQKQVELLKTMPPALTPYYKKQVNEYFQKLDN